MNPDTYFPIPNEACAPIAHLTDRVKVVSGEFLSHQGELAHEFFVIVDGTAQVVRDNRVVGTLRPGEFFGEIGLLGKPYRTATVRALSDMKLAVMPRREFRTMLPQLPEVASTILAAGSSRIEADLLRLAPIVSVAEPSCRRARLR